MKIQYFDNYELLSEAAAEIVLQNLRCKPHSTLCTATGHTPTYLYNLLVEGYNQEPELFARVNIVKLDEWGGIPMDHPESCESYLQNNVIKPLRIPRSRYLSFNSLTDDPQLECQRIQTTLTENGGIDLCILGLGANGHVAFNEPREYLNPDCHVAELTEKSLQHQMAINMDKKKLYGLTMGMADIFSSKVILMLITGSNKSEIVNEFLKRRITTSLPASLLWMHPNAFCLVDNNVFNIH